MNGPRIPGGPPALENAFFVRREELPASFVEQPLKEISRGVWFEEPPDTEGREWVSV